MTSRTADGGLPPVDAFVDRHIGPRASEVASMLEAVGYPSLEALTDAAVPAAIRSQRPLELPAALSEVDALEDLRALASQNAVLKSCIGMGYYDTLTPPVILRNILENPGWYTQYTPYQAEISQGRMEALLNFQTLVMDLTGLDCANSSLLDEATAAAEAMTLCRRVNRKAGGVFLVDVACHPQTLAVIQTRAEPLGIDVVVADVAGWDFTSPTFGLLVQVPDTFGDVKDQQDLASRARAHGALVVVAADLLALTQLAAPGTWGADVVVGSSQRFGVPLGFGGPHAAFMAARDEFKRQVPGRIIGVSKDVAGHPAMRLALQTREQHIRREKATSNICTAQVLLAVTASMYAVYHGPEGLDRIARRVRGLTAALAAGLERAGWTLRNRLFFDTLTVDGGDVDGLPARAEAAGYALRHHPDGAVGIALDETTTPDDVARLLTLLGASTESLQADLARGAPPWPSGVGRATAWLTHPVFQQHRSESRLLRYIKSLEARDLSLTTSMIPLGSCTMKLNATAEMIPVTWKGFGGLHPFAPAHQARGYHELFRRLKAYLAEITGFSGVSLQPNAGSQGEYAGLLVIRALHRARGQGHRTVCLIPTSAHGTNPASAIMAGMDVVVVACDDNGNVDLEDLRAKAEKHSERLAALMVTYPSTHGVFEPTIKRICELVHAHGGRVYLDGANMNALVGLCRPAELGADVCHLNLHKTFCIPHGGGGPGMGPICVTSELAPFLPGHPVVDGVGGSQAIGPVSAAPWGSPSILPISYAYIRLMGPDGLRRATEVAILGANYLAARLEPYFPVVYRGPNGRVAHECIVDVRGLESAGVRAVDVAKRLMDYGFHAPTMSWPVAGTLMIEPTESEDQGELDRLCQAMIAIRKEADAIAAGVYPEDDNPLRNAPHTARMVTASVWEHPYSREQAAFPASWLHRHKFWPAVRRVDDAFGDRNLVCACPPLDAYED